MADIFGLSLSFYNPFDNRECFIFRYISFPLRQPELNMVYTSIGIVYGVRSPARDDKIDILHNYTPPLLTTITAYLPQIVKNLQRNHSISIP